MHNATRMRRRLRSGAVIASVIAAAGSIGASSAGALIALSPTKTNVVCNPNVAPGHADICGVSVTDVGRNPTPPTGTVSLATNVGVHRGTFSKGGQCVLMPVDQRTSRCSFTYTPRFGQPTRVYANYPGDRTHARSHGHTDINARPPVPNPGPPPTGGPPPTTGCDPVANEPTGFASDRREDNAELAAAAAAGNEACHDAILADILADVPTT